PNVALFVAVRTREREALFRWVGPISRSSTSFYSRRGAEVRVASLDDARQVASIAVPREWYSHQVLRGLGFVNLELVPKPHEMARMTLYGRVPLMVYEDQLLPSLLSEIGASMDDVQRVHTFMRSSSYIAFSLGTSEQVIQRWQQALDGMKADGSFDSIHRQWLAQVALTGMVAEPAMLPLAARRLPQRGIYPRFLPNRHCRKGSCRLRAAAHVTAQGESHEHQEQACRGGHS